MLEYLRKNLNGFLSWWFGELGALLPARIKRVFTSTVERLVIDVFDDHAGLRVVSGQKENALGRIDFGEANPQANRVAVSALTQGLETGNMVVTLRLPPGQALRKMLDLPAAAEENLGQVLEFEMDRQTPFSLDDVYFDYRIVKHDRERQRVGVELVVMTRLAVDTAVSQVRDWGIAPDEVDIAWSDAIAKPPMNLLPQSHGRRPSRFTYAVNFALAGIAVGLLVAAVLIPLDRQRTRAEALEIEVTEARQEAEAARKIREEISALLTQGDFIGKRKIAQPTVTEVVAEVSRLLPDDTWLFRLRLFDDELQIFGYSSAASALIGLLESSSIFEQAQFRAPLTRDPRIQAERFHIGFRVVKRPLP